MADRACTLAHLWRLTARGVTLTLGCALVACGGGHGATRVAASGTEALGDDAPARRARTFDLVYAAGANRDCDREHVECFRDCWTTKPPYPYKNRSGDHHGYCTSTCLKAYMQCVKEAESRPVTFPSMQSAVTWLEQHKTTAIIGTVVLVAGSAYVITAVAGGLVLLPIAAAT